MTPEALAERLTLLGMEVKGIERWGADWQQVVVGELLAVEKHPRADRLSLTRVTVGDRRAARHRVRRDEHRARPARARGAAGGRPAGRPADRAHREDGRRQQRHALLRRRARPDLGRGRDPDPAGGHAHRRAPSATSSATSCSTSTSSPTAATPSRSSGSRARSPRSTGAPLRFPPTDVEEAGRPTAERLTVEVGEPDLCPRFVGRWASGVTVGPSPDAVQMRLLAAGLRPISNVVDASNYVMVELGKPIHTFDAAAVHDGRIVVRRGEGRGTLETLDHVVRDLHPETLLIADPAGPLAIAGVMGGASSEVGPGTTEVVIESAIFDPISIRRTAFRYALRSEASLRFEKGMEWRLARLGADRTARLIAEWAGGTIAPGVVDSNPVDPPAATVSFRPARVNRLLGTTFGPDEQRELLARVGIETAPAGPGARVVVAAAPKPLEVDAGTDEVIEATIPTLAARPRDRGRHHRGGHPRPRLRARAAAAPGYADAGIPPRPAGTAPCRPRDARRCRPDRGRDLRARGAAGRRAVPGARRRAA